MDRHDSGNKFCFIHNTDGFVLDNRDTITNCTFIAPKDTTGAPDVGSMIFLNDGYSIYMANNIFKTDLSLSGSGASAGVGGQLSYDSVTFVNNVFDSISYFETTAKNDFLKLAHNSGTVANSGSVLMFAYRTLWSFNNALASISTSIYNTTPDSTLTDSLYVGASTNWTTNFGWTDWSTGDYSIGESSPLVDAGTDVGVTTTYDGENRDVNPDIGAYEYQSEGEPQVNSNNNFYRYKNSLIKYK